MIVLIFLGGLESSSMVAATCQTVPRASYEVTLAVEPVTIATSFSLADIKTLARGSSDKVSHPPVGFYIGTLSYSIDVVRSASLRQCSDWIAVHVSMSILGRRIEIGHELTSRKCLYSAFLNHYRKHADDDVDLIERYRKRVEHTLRGRPPRLPDEENASTSVGRTEIQRITAKTVETALQGLSEERATAAERVDTPDEVRRLTDACADRA